LAAARLGFIKFFNHPRRKLAEPSGKPEEKSGKTQKKIAPPSPPERRRFFFALPQPTFAELGRNLLDNVHDEVSPKNMRVTAHFCFFSCQ
jgi:hypothetical protein